MNRLFLTCLLLTTAPLCAEVKLSKLFSDHMVLQRDQTVPVWGWAEPGETVTVSFAGQSVTGQAGADRTWMVKLAALPTNALPQSLTAKGSSEVTVTDVLVGEVWICSGQSNMGFTTGGAIDGDLDALSAKPLGKLRLLTLNTPGTQTPIAEPDRPWVTATEQTIPGFSAVGFYFGRQLLSTLDIPIGLINNSWGGSSCEAWIRRDLFAGKELYAPLLERWQKIEAENDTEDARTKYAEALAKWKTDSAAAKAAQQPQPKPPTNPQEQLTGQHRPANLYHGRLKPLMPMAFRGVIWYQGESNASHAYQYRDMFPLMIKNWRDDWGHGNFPFYWAQLADFQAEKPEPGDANWAELREAQTMTLSAIPNGGEAVIDDLGEANDIHPRKKLSVGLRLARWALAKDYGIKVDYQSPTYTSMEKQGNKIMLSFKAVGKGLRALDIGEVKGFAIAGEDKQWKWAEAKVVGADKVEVSAAEVTDPVAVRYAWADNPVCNLYSLNGLPVTPFRTDTWPGLTAEAK